MLNNIRNLPDDPNVILLLQINAKYYLCCCSFQHINKHGEFYNKLVELYKIHFSIENKRKGAKIYISTIWKLYHFDCNFCYKKTKCTHTIQIQETKSVFSALNNARWWITAVVNNLSGVGCTLNVNYYRPQNLIHQVYIQTLKCTKLELVLTENIACLLPKTRRSY